MVVSGGLTWVLLCARVGGLWEAFWGGVVRAYPGRSPLQAPPPQKCVDSGLLWEASRNGSCPIKIDFSEGLGAVPGAAGAPQAWPEWALRARGIGMLGPRFAARAAGWAVCPWCGSLGLMGTFTWTDGGQAGWEVAGPRGPVSRGPRPVGQNPAPLWPQFWAAWPEGVTRAVQLLRVTHVV